jgi:hypothetical protein
MTGEFAMGSATGFLWLAVVILALGWALQLTGTVNLGLNLNVWLPVLLVITLAGAVFNMFIVPFLGRTRTTRNTASASGIAAAPSPVVAAPTPGSPAAGASQQEVVQETRDRPSL